MTQRDQSSSAAPYDDSPIPSGWQRHIPVVPDRIVTEQFMPIVIVDGREYGSRDENITCSSRAAAVELGELFAKNIGHSRVDRVVILRREVGPWQEDGALYPEERRS